MADEWTIVRPSTPAKYIAGVPDDAVVYHCAVTDDQSVTVYTTPNRKFIVLSRGGDNSRVEEVDPEADVETLVDEICAGWSPSDDTDVDWTEYATEVDLPTVGGDA